MAVLLTIAARRLETTALSLFSCFKGSIRIKSMSAAVLSKGNPGMAAPSVCYALT
jgi:hypothetical protein